MVNGQHLYQMRPLMYMVCFYHFSKLRVRKTDTRLLYRPTYWFESRIIHLMMHNLPSMLLRQHSRNGVSGLAERDLIYFAVGTDW
jgi:hypothetical protein